MCFCIVLECSLQSHSTCVPKGPGEPFRTVHFLNSCHRMPGTPGHSFCVWWEGFRVHKPKIYHFDLRIIWDWRQLKRSKHKKNLLVSPFYNSFSGGEALIWYLFFILYWNIVDFQCCANFCCTAKWPSPMVYNLISTILTQDSSWFCLVQKWHQRNLHSKPY